VSSNVACTLFPTNEKIAWSRDRTEKLIVSQLDKKIPAFCITECSLPCSQQPTTSPILSHMNPVHTFTCIFHTISFNSILPSSTMSFEWSLSSNLSKQKFLRISYHPMRSTCLTNLILLNFNSVQFFILVCCISIIVVICGEKYAV
jgi:hypothetical protein